MPPFRRRPPPGLTPALSLSSTSVPSSPKIRRVAPPHQRPVHPHLNSLRDPVILLDPSSATAPSCLALAKPELRSSPHPYLNSSLPSRRLVVCCLYPSPHRHPKTTHCPPLAVFIRRSPLRSTPVLPRLLPPLLSCCVCSFSILPVRSCSTRRLHRICLLSRRPLAPVEPHSVPSSCFHRQIRAPEVVVVAVRVVAAARRSLAGTVSPPLTGRHRRSPEQCFRPLEQKKLPPSSSCH